MGFTPRQVGEMSLWEFTAAFDGWKAANGGEKKAEAPSADEFEAALRGLD